MEHDAAAVPAFRSHLQPVPGPLAAHCRALIGVDVQPGPHAPLAVVPHDSVVLSLQLAAGADPFARVAGERGMMLHLCGLREARHDYRPLGDCRTFFALLTPDAALSLAHGQPLPGGPGPRQPLAHWWSRPGLVQLEDALARHGDDLQEQLRQFGAWLDQALQRRTHVPWQARRAARAVGTLFARAEASLDEVAAGEGLSRRQLERDFRGWLATTPKQAGVVARVQAAARLGFQGVPLAEVAQRLGFADQSHMNRVVKKLTGTTPRALFATRRNGMSAAFRAATGGGVVYL